MSENKTATVTENIRNSVSGNVFLFPISSGQVLVTGIAPYTKDGKTSFILSGIKCYEDYQKLNGSYGFEAFTEWTNRCDLGYLNVGDIVEVQYGKGFKGAAVLINCKVVGHVDGSLKLIK